MLAGLFFCRLFYIGKKIIKGYCFAVYARYNRLLSCIFLFRIEQVEQLHVYPDICPLF